MIFCRDDPSAESPINICGLLDENEEEISATVESSVLGEYPNTLVAIKSTGMEVPFAFVKEIVAIPALHLFILQNVCGVGSAETVMLSFIVSNEDGVSVWVEGGPETL